MPRVESPSLFGRAIYQSQMGRLHAKSRARPHQRPRESFGLPFAAVQRDGSRLAGLIAREVASGGYRFRPLQVTQAHLAGKRRVLYRPDWLDAIVLGAIAQRLTLLAEARLSNDVHSYRPGRSSHRALHRLRAYLAEHRRAHPDVEERGLWVLQRDIARYGESIPTHCDSALWPQLDDLLEGVSDRREASHLRTLLESACKPRYIDRDGELQTMTHGLPTGSPIQQPLANLYLSPLDQALGGHDGCLYARFGDDLLFASPRLAQASDAFERIEAATARLELTLEPSKSKNLYFTGPGRPPARSPEAWLVRPTSHIEYLGARLDFQGNLGLKRRHCRQLQQRWRQRIRQLLATAAPSERLVTLAAGLRCALEPNGDVSDPAVASLSDWVDDRRQLRDLDYLLALDCAQALGGQLGVRAFRSFPPRLLRNEGLPSLAHRRRRRGGVE